MMYSEFREISNADITSEQYETIIEPMYQASSMNKEDFVSFMLPSLKALEKQNVKPKEQRTVFVSDGSMTPNGCYYMGRYYKVVKESTSLKTGKTTYTLRHLTKEEQAATGWDDYLAYDIDINTFSPNVIIKVID